VAASVLVSIMSFRSLWLLNRSLLALHSHMDCSTVVVYNFTNNVIQAITKTLQESYGVKHVWGIPFGYKVYMYVCMCVRE
jgi:hypothetical protein